MAVVIACVACTADGSGDHPSPSPPALLLGFDIVPGPGCTEVPPKRECSVLAALATETVEVGTASARARVYVRSDGRAQYEGHYSFHPITISAEEYGVELGLRGVGLRLAHRTTPARHGPQKVQVTF